MSLPEEKMQDKDSSIYTNPTLIMWKIFNYSDGPGD